MGRCASGNIGYLGEDNEVVRDTIGFDVPVLDMLVSDVLDICVIEFQETIEHTVDFIP